ncbi:ATP-grasp domain-containing protein [Rariglobus hedericola]|uniref:DUF4343 domain-containing protein n=1 Tax=Rariglobus hedericola TaxID=2597822 RepID=A0A556QMW8_9BACT|nr:ATP-grasp domain-containing protein [Rariglobus hedericola]TSJ77942.1 DUF4343 domain-containing protein [Rariglobus hedericola]
MNTAGLNLLIPDKPDTERDALAAVFRRGGGEVHRIGRFWDPPAFDPATVRVYGPDSFCLVLQQKLGFPLCSPDDDLLLRLPPEFLRRELSRKTLGDALASGFPLFIKPMMPKQFRGAVYRSAEALADECRGITMETPVLVAEPVTITAEVRCFALDGSVLAAAVYEGKAEVAEAVQFTRSVIKSLPLPRAVVIDVGLVAERGWAVIEFNAAWGAGLNGCDPESALSSIVTASAIGEEACSDPPS